MATPTVKGGAVAAPNQWVESNGRRLAYRTVGAGTPLVLCTRFRGNLDTWDPAIPRRPRGPRLPGGDLRLQRPGAVDRPAQLRRAGAGPGRHRPGRRAWFRARRHRRLVARRPGRAGLRRPAPRSVEPGGADRDRPPRAGGDAARAGLLRDGRACREPVRRRADPLLRAGLGLEPRGGAPVGGSHRRPGRGTRASRCRPTGRPPTWPTVHPVRSSRPTRSWRRSRRRTVPILHIGGDHDVSFPVENWYALNRQLPTLQLVTFPQTGHGPQHQHPEASAAIIAAFVGTH